MSIEADAEAGYGRPSQAAALRWSRLVQAPAQAAAASPAAARAAPRAAAHPPAARAAPPQRAAALDALVSVAAHEAHAPEGAGAPANPKFTVRFRERPRPGADPTYEGAGPLQLSPVKRVRKPQQPREPPGASPDLAPAAAPAKVPKKRGRPRKVQPEGGALGLAASGKLAPAAGGKPQQQAPSPAGAGGQKRPAAAGAEPAQAPAKVQRDTPTNSVVSPQMVGGAFGRAVFGSKKRVREPCCSQHSPL